MNRLGFTRTTFDAALARLRALACVGQITLLSHFARADDEEGIGAQMAMFKSLAGGLGHPLSLANSARVASLSGGCGRTRPAGHHALRRITNA